MKWWIWVIIAIVVVLIILYFAYQASQTALKKAVAAGGICETLNPPGIATTTAGVSAVYRVQATNGAITYYDANGNLVTINP